MNPSESQQDLLSNEVRAPSVQSLSPPTDYVLGPVEKHFLLSAERGDCATVKRYRKIIECLIITIIKKKKKS